MDEILRDFLDQPIGINYEDPRKVVAAVLHSVNRSYLTLYPYKDKDRRSLHFPVGDIRSISEAPLGERFRVRSGDGVLASSVDVPIIVELARPLYPKDGVALFAVVS